MKIPLPLLGQKGPQTVNVALAKTSGSPDEMAAQIFAVGILADFSTSKVLKPDLAKKCIVALVLFDGRKLNIKELEEISQNDTRFLREVMDWIRNSYFRNVAAKN